MRNNTIGPNGTNFIHEEDFTGTVRVITGSVPHQMNTPDDFTPAYWVDIPFEDIRHLVLRYLRELHIKNIETMSDDGFAAWVTAGDDPD